MLIGFVGPQGEGKSLGISLFASLFHHRFKSKLYANYGLKDSQRVYALDDFWEMRNAIFCFDEIWLTMDSRLWKDNVALSRWLLQTRKKGMLIMYTAQHINQVDIRIRQATNVMVFCKKTKEGHWFQFSDWLYQVLGRRYLLNTPERFYHLYDSFEEINCVKISEKYHEQKPKRNWKE